MKATPEPAKILYGGVEIGILDADVEIIPNVEKDTGHPGPSIGTITARVSVDPQQITDILRSAIELEMKRMLLSDQISLEQWFRFHMMLNYDGFERLQEYNGFLMEV